VKLVRLSKLPRAPVVAHGYGRPEKSDMRLLFSVAQKDERPYNLIMDTTKTTTQDGMTVAVGLKVRVAGAQGWRGVVETIRGEWIGIRELGTRRLDEVRADQLLGEV
jgi:hypothetical protein